MNIQQFYQFLAVFEDIVKKREEPKGD